MVRETIVLTRQEVSGQVDIGEVIGAIERCMAEFEKGEDLLPPKYIIDLPGGISACMAGYTKATGMLTMKLGQERKANVHRGLPTTMGTINLYDPETGELLMVVESVLATMYRTAAAAAVAAKFLARKDAEALAVIGAGQLGRQCVRAASRVRPFKQIVLFDVRREQAERVAAELASELSVPIQVVDVEQACRQADVICTATNSTEPIVRSAWVRPGTHLSCMGADLHSKIECEMELMPRCRLFADKVEHCLERGEVSQAVEKGILGRDCFAGSLGQAIIGQIAGRSSEDQITLFDGIGIGVQDTTVARSIYDQAVAKGLGLRVAFC
ncbi:MAG: ornithine cyclodeaminase family protein [Prosthecobacter sp.]|uniref:ornithine cyclodeaminase family protein n=1 Tax=Prosthecobacter sp. TaxID=1965333 RepID=UPI0039027E38